MGKLSVCATLAAVVLAGCGGGGAPGATERAAQCQLGVTLPADDGTAPRSRLDLGHWQLTLPVDDAGGTSGPARTVETDELLAGYASPWFHGTDDAGVALFAPVNGARMPNSPYARSELREVVDPADPSQNWRISGPARMAASLAVTQVPAATGQLVIGKITGYSSSNAHIVLLRLVYELDADSCRGSLHGLLTTAPTVETDTRIDLATDAIPLGGRFDYVISVEDGVLTLESGAAQRTMAIDPRWADTPVYFRAGAGLTALGATSADGGAVTLYDLDVTH